MIDRSLGNACAIVAFSALALSCGGGTIAATAGGRYMSVPIKNGAPTAWELDANGRFGLHVFADRLGLEIYSLDGLQYAPVATIVPDPAQRGISLSSGGAQAPMREVSAKAWRLKSVWEKGN